MDEQMIELKECPLCGDKDDYNPSVSSSYGYVEPGDPALGTTGNPAAGLKETGRYVECDKCGCCGPTRPAEAEAVAAWNTRAARGVIAGKVAELEREAALVHEALDEAMRRYPDARPALAWFGAASGLSAGEITQEVLDWANAALAPYPERRSE